MRPQKYIKLLKHPATSIANYMGAETVIINEKGDVWISNPAGGQYMTDEALEEFIDWHIETRFGLI